MNMLATDRLPEPCQFLGSVVLQAADPILLEHRDYVYEKHLKLPLDF